MMQNKKSQDKKMMKKRFEHIKTIGVTGGVGCGKSVVMEMLEKEFGGMVILADLTAHELMQPGGESYRQILEEFGEEILAEDSTIDRNRLSALVFQDPKKLARLNEITHPNVITEIMRRLQEADQAACVPFAAVEAALLLESGIAEEMDTLWYIHADVDTRLKRLQEGRGYSYEKSLSVMEKQRKEEDFRKACPVVIDNSGTVEETRTQVRAALEKLLSA